MAIKKTEYIKFGENLYEVIPPFPSGEDRGGIIASPKESTDTVEVKLGGDGKLYVPTYPDLSKIDTSAIQAQIDEHVDDTDVHVTTEEKNKLSNIDTNIDSKISTHNTATSAHNDIRALISDLAAEVSNFLDVDDNTRDQLSEVLALIDSNKGTLESLTTNKVNVSDIVNNLTTASANKVLSANQGVVLKTLIDELEALVETKADASALSNYYTKAEIDKSIASKSDVQLINSDSSEFLSTLKIYKMTQNEYDQTVESGALEENAIYITPQEDVDLSIYATKENLEKKADALHTHDDMYYTETEVDELLSTIAAAEHDHNDMYYTESEIDSKISAMKSYIDTLVAQKSQVQIITWEADD